MLDALIPLGIFSAVILLVAVSILVNRRREAFIQNYSFPATIPKKLKTRYPHLTDEQINLVIQGLRDYFKICNRAGKRMIAMPSQAVDEAWHEFILFTRAYADFCRRGLGRFLHHTPAEAMSAPTLAHDGIKRAWRLSCKRERIKPRSPDRLPLLFALDAQLNIPDGFYYSLNCRLQGTDNDNYCASHIGCGGGCAGGGGDGDGCGGGCGGD